MEAILGFVAFLLVAGLAIRFIIRREKKLGNDIVQDVKDLVD
jgi:hypothetical protein